MHGTGLKVANAIGYQVVWLACVAGAGGGHAWLGPLVSLVFVATMLAFGGRRRDDLRLLALALAVGLLLDGAFAATGWMRYAAAWPWVDAAPVWILALWAAFALTLNHSLSFLRHRPWLTALLGFVGGPLAYASAAGAFDAVDFGAPMPWVMAALAVGWACALPLIFRIDGLFLAPSPRAGLA